ncbi:unnamed protein product, partial [Meganyctiphanes norvegica]
GQFSPSCLRVSLSRPSGSRDQCSFPSLGRLGLTVSLSSSGTLEPSGSSPLPLPWLRRSRGPSLPSGTLVPFSSPPVSGSRSSPGFPFSLPNHLPRAGVSPHALRLLPSRVETMSSGLRSSGHSSSSIRVLLLAHKVSTSHQYQSIWSKFMSFLSMRNVTDSLLSSERCVGLVCDFLSFHLLTHNRQYRTITTYRSALRHPILFSCGVDIKSISSDLFLRGAFNFRPPLRAKSMPCWSLNGLLSFLSCAVFEPLESASF